MLILKRQPGMEDEIAKARIHACRCRTTSSMSKSKNTPQTQHQVATSMAHVDREAVVFAERLSRFHFPQRKVPDLFDTGQALKCASCVVFSAFVLSRLNSIDDLLCIICVSRFHFPSPASIILCCQSDSNIQQESVACASFGSPRSGLFDVPHNGFGSFTMRVRTMSMSLTTS